MPRNHMVEETVLFQAGLVIKIPDVSNFNFYLQRLAKIIL